MTGARAVRGLWASSHPGPTLVVTVLAAALGVAAGLDAWRLTLLTGAVFAGQLSVGISNDAIDARRDRSVGRSDKPLARGEVSVRTAWVAAVGCLLLALALSAPLGAGLLGMHALALASAWSYNAGLKASAFSVAPFVLSFGLFPSFATLAAAEPQFALPWAWAAGGALGAAVHLTNVLPDLDDDARTGITGLPHRIGARPAAAVAAAAVLAGAVAVTAGPVGGDVHQVPVISWVFFVLVVVLVLVILTLVGAGRSGRELFRLVMLVTVVLAVQLVASGGSLVP
ncbi:UbiA family prenyltransferase [Nesterenkonia muleiensis]|uniref:UbiA family prenyltransferase n=1 Tax=Nesterenkonia muleiensis TaxID=2282648 RepID=UPI000E74A0F9|nr:UbiA family prenyltransferase [Nesterenkonia muleiensis]